MPVDAGASKDGVVFQREQYAKGGIGRKYWDYRDDSIIEAVAGSFRPGSRVVDVGCGEGILLEKLVKRYPGADLEGLDLDPLNIAICAEHVLRVREGGAYALPYETASLDLCLFIEVIEHLEKPEDAITELYRVLKPGGRLAVLFPNDATFKLARLATGMVKEAYYDTGHLRQWTPRALGRTLRAAGFKVLLDRSLPLPFFPMALHHLTVAGK
jgi:ubiquinone/menaquinone biosynthesis C-methylase UbiE